MNRIGLLSLITLLLAILFGVSLTGCGPKGNGNIVVEKRTLGTFNQIYIEQSGKGSGIQLGDEKASAFHIKLIKDSLAFVTIEYDQNLMHHIKTECVNNRLSISTPKTLYSTRDINVNVHYTVLSQIDINSFAELVFGTPFRGQTLQINLSGASEMEGEVYAETLLMDMSGAAELELKGKVRKLKGDFSGAGDIHCYDLVTDTCLLDISGAADAQLNVQHYLRIDVSGAADVSYKGNPTIDKEVSGAGEIKKADSDNP